MIRRAVRAHRVASPHPRNLLRAATADLQADRPHVRGADGRAMAVRRRRRLLVVAEDLGRAGELDPSAHLRRGVSRRVDQRAPDPARHHLPGPADHALHDRRGADVHVGAPDSPDRRTHRDPLSRLRVARVPRLLPRLARAGAGDAGRRRSTISCAARSGRSRSTACSRRARGDGSSTPAGSSSRTSCSSARACAARGSCGPAPSAPPNWKAARATSPATSSVRLTDGSSPATNRSPRSSGSGRGRKRSTPMRSPSIGIRPLARSTWLPCGKRSGSSHYESTLTRPDGTTISVLENAIGTFDGQGELVEIRGFILDITDRKSIEVELAKARDAALESARLKSRIPGQHEPRNPDADERRRRHGRPAARNRPDGRAARVHARPSR